MTRPALAERLWRVRKHHLWIDAQLHERDGSIQLQIFYRGELVLTRQWPTRELAVIDAETRLRELQRVGWNTHW